MLGIFREDGRRVSLLDLQQSFFFPAAILCGRLRAVEPHYPLSSGAVILISPISVPVTCYCEKSKRSCHHTKLPMAAGQGISYSATARLKISRSCGQGSHL